MGRDMIQFINKPDSAGFGRIVVDGRSFGVPIAANVGFESRPGPLG